MSEIKLYTHKIIKNFCTTCLSCFIKKMFDFNQGISLKILFS